jgi:hypothetical protein
VPTVSVPGVFVASASGVHSLAVPSDAVAEALAATLALALAAADADAEALGDAPAPSSCGRKTKKITRIATSAIPAMARVDLVMVDIEESLQFVLSNERECIPSSKGLDHRRSMAIAVPAIAPVRAARSPRFTASARSPLESTYKTAEPSST